MSSFIKQQLALLKKHYDLIPLLSMVALSSSLGIFCLVRTAATNPDVSWNKDVNPEPWNKIQQTQRTKLLPTPHIDYANAKFPQDRPSMANDKYKDI